MHCPKCGHPASHDARFCSRCGLSLTAVSEILANGGFPVESEANPTSRRRRGMRMGAKIMFLSAVLFPVFLGLTIPADSPEPLFVPFTVFLAGLSWLLYFRLFGDEEQREKRHQIHRFDIRADRAAIHAQDSARVEGSFFIARQTGEIEQPSVTEATTHLFDQQ